MTAAFAAAGMQLHAYPTPASSTLTIRPEGDLVNAPPAALFNTLGQPVTTALELYPLRSWT